MFSQKKENGEFLKFLNPLCGWPDAFAHKSNQSSIKKAGIYIFAPYFALFLSNLSLPSVIIDQECNFDWGVFN